MHHKSILLLILSGLFSFAAFSQADSPRTDEFADELEWMREERIVFTATKTPERLSKSGNSVTVITAREIRNMGARTLEDILETVPGLGITESNVGRPEIEVRGIKTEYSEKVLLMVDNVPMLNPNDGGYLLAFTYLTVDNIKKVEVVRGPVSGLYGANAFLAVVHVITKKAKDVKGFELSAGRGSYNTQKYNMLFGNLFHGVDVLLNLNFFDSDGFSGFVEQDFMSVLDQRMNTNVSMAPGYTDNWERRFDLDLKLGYKDFNFQGRYIKRDSGPYAGDVLDDETRRRHESCFLSLGYTKEISRNLKAALKLYRSFDSFDDHYEIFPEGFRNGDFPDGMIGEPHGKIVTYGGEINFTFAHRKNNKLLAGLNAEHQRQYDLGGSTNFDPCTGVPLGSIQDLFAECPFNRNTSRKFYAPYIEDIWDIRDDLRLIGGVRYDYYNDFGGSFNPRASLIWEFRQGYDLRLHYGTAFRAPTFQELYNENNPSTEGDLDLDPEEVATFEIGIVGELMDSFTVGITAFHSKIKNLLQSAQDEDGKAIFLNIGKARTQGVELELKKKFKGGSFLTLNYTYQDPEDDLSGERLPDVPAHKGNILFNYRISRYFNFYTGLFLKDTMPRAKGDTRSDVSGYAIVNMGFTAKKFLPGFEGLEIDASVHNLFDKEYWDPSPANSMPSDYPQPDFNFFIDMSYHF